MTMKRLLSSVPLAALLAATVITGAAQQPAPPVDTSKLGPQMGTAVPPVSGVDQFGTAQTLASLSGPKGLMLVFSRSADW